MFKPLAPFNRTRFAEMATAHADGSAELYAGLSVFAVLLLSCLALLLATSEPYRSNLLLRGERVEATIVAVEQWRVGKSPAWRANFVFTLQGGRSYSGSSDAPNPRDIDLTGKKIEVLYDPKQPEINAPRKYLETTERNSRVLILLLTLAGFFAALVTFRYYQFFRSRSRAARKS